MTELEQLREQVQELKKTVDDLKSGTVKIVPLKDRLSQEQCKIFNKYFSSFDDHDEYWNREENFAKPGIIVANEKKDLCRNGIRDTVKAIYIMNHFSEYKNELSYCRIDKFIKTEEQIQEYLQLFESMCQITASKVKNDRFVSNLEK